MVDRDLSNEPLVSLMVTIFSEYFINLYRVSLVLGILLDHVADKITSFMYWFYVLRRHWLSKSHGLTHARIFSRLEGIESEWL